MQSVKKLDEHQVWEIGYFANQSAGLAELACEKDSIPINERMKKWRNEVIQQARDFRKRLLSRYGLWFFGNIQLICIKDNSAFSSTDYLEQHI